MGQGESGPWQAAQCDEVCCAVEALNDELGPSFSLKGEEQKRERERADRHHHRARPEQIPGSILTAIFSLS